MTAIQVGGGRVAGLDAEELAVEFGTPLYVYDLDAIADRVRALAAALPPVFSLAFAAKANPSLAVLNQFAALGLGLDVASAGELEAGRRAGVTPDRIVFTGPGKTTAELAAAVEAGLRAITVESAGELARLAEAATDIRRVVPILLRVAVRHGAEPAPILGSGWRKFGIDPGELPDVARRAQASPWLDLLGIHAFGDSNVLDAGAIVAHVARTVDLAACLAREIGFSLRLVDVGGGLGVPYDEDVSELDLTRLGSGLARLAAAWEADADLAELSVLMEPGRYLTGPCGLLLTRVVDTKRVGGQAVVIVDGGLHHAARPALLGMAHRLRLVADRPQPAGTEPVVVAGPLCTGLDIFPGGLPAVPEPGDLVAVCDLGAYGFTESMPYFLSHPTPAEVVVRGGRAHLARRRVDPAELLDQQQIPVG